MKRHAFTIVELLVVIAIIAMLASLITGAAIMARSYVRKSTVQLEINQLDMALKMFKEKYGQYPPDFCGRNTIVAPETISPRLSNVQRFIYKAWPRCSRLPVDFNGTTLPDKYHAGTALVYWLAGIKDADGNFIGFSSDPTNPFDVDTSGNPVAANLQCQSRVRPFFDFAKPRILPNSDNMDTYWPDCQSKDVTNDLAGYVYFRAENGKYTDKDFAGNTSCLPSSDGKILTSTVWMSPQSFQIRCCGVDGKWWDDPATKSWSSKFGIDEGETIVHRAGYDDMFNFATGTLEDNVP